MNRRHFIQSLGLTGAGLGLGTGLGAIARAAEGDAPKRLLVISHCHGWPYDYWKMRPGGLGESTPWELDLGSLAQGEVSQVLAPLYDFRRRMIHMDGLSLATAELDVDGNRHDTGWVHAWTGDNADFSGTTTGAMGQSLDQRVAAEIARSDRLPSLELSINGNNEPGRPIAYAATGMQLPVLNTPDLVWSRLFGPSVGDATLAARQRDVLAFADGEYRAARRNLGRMAKQRLDAHFELLLGLGDRIEGMAALQCPDVPQVPTSLASYDATFDVYADLIAAAFSCDITRVVSLSLGEMPTADFGADHITDDVHKGLAHEIYNDPAKYVAMADYLTHHSGQVARLVALLEATPDVDGRSVMDNTLIVWGSELGNGWHGYQTYCPTIIGGDWHFRTGRYLHLPHETPIEMMVPTQIETGGYTQMSGRPHQHLLVSVAQAMGVDVDHFGIHLAMGQRGDHVDCSGPLEELT
jgi:hypothetical protein